MQAIERYGVVALLLLIATVVAVLVWDGAPAGPSSTVAAAEDTAALREAAPDSERMTEPRVERREDPGWLELSGPAENRRLIRGAAPQERSDARGGLVPSGTSGDEEEYGYGEEQVDGWRPPRDAYHPSNSQPEPPIETADLRAQPAPRRRDGRQPERVEPTPVQLQPVADTRPGQVRPYVIQKGDTLGEIALRELGTSKRWREIRDLNPKVDEKRLLVGKELLLPAGAAPAGDRGQPAPVAQTPGRVAQATATGPTYRVQNGDSMWKIAKRILGDGERYREIKALNPKIDADKLRVGQTLVLPVDARTTSQPIIASTETGTSRSRRVR